MASELESRTKNALRQFDSNMSGIFDRKSFYEGAAYSASTGSPRLNHGQQCFKLSLLSVNVVFLIFGIVLMSVGSYALNNQIGALAGQSVPMGLIVLGVFIMLLALLGALAAWRESRGFLGIYFVFLLIFTIILFAIGIAVYVKKDQSAQYLTTGWNSAGLGVQLAIQNLINCCGLTSYNSTGAGCPASFAAIQPPDTTGTTIPYCLPLMVTTFNASFQTAGSCGIAFSIVMLAGLALVCYLMSGIKRKEEEVDIAKLRTGGEEQMANMEEGTSQQGQEEEEVQHEQQQEEEEE